MSQWPTTITQDDINAYAEVSGDFNPIHVDPEFASTTPFGTTIAHGCIAGAVITRHAIEKLGASGGPKRLSVKFTGPTRSGDSLSCTAEIDVTAEGLAVGEAAYKITCANQKNETVAIGSAVIVQE